MPSIDDWKRDLITEDHFQRQNFAKNSLQRNFREKILKRVTHSSSSSSSDKVAILDCCWAKGHRTGSSSPAVPKALASSLFCALSGGAVCILNTSDSVKSYLFGADSSRRSGKDYHDNKKKDITTTTTQHDWRRDRLSAIDCIPLPRRLKKGTTDTPTVSTNNSTTNTSSNTTSILVKSISKNTSAVEDESMLLVCTMTEGWICTFLAEPELRTHARSINIEAVSVHKAIELPSNDILPGKGIWEKARIRFSPKGSRIIAVVSSILSYNKVNTNSSTSSNATENMHHVNLFCILKRQEIDSLETYILEKPWTRVLAPCEKYAAQLLHFSWWDDIDESLILTIWSDGTVSIINMELETITETSIFINSAEQIPGRVTIATSVPPVYNITSSGRTSLIQQLGVIALVLDENIVTIFTVQNSLNLTTKLLTRGDEPPLKSNKVEIIEKDKINKNLILQAGYQNYCSEDIPIRDLALFDNFLPYNLAVLLESGALIVLDTITMDLLYHRPLSRIFPTIGTKGKQQLSDKRDGGTNEVDIEIPYFSYFIKPKEKPMAMCIIEYNTAVVLRSS